MARYARSDASPAPNQRQPSREAGPGARGDKLEPATELIDTAPDVVQPGALDRLLDIEARAVVDDLEEQCRRLPPQTHLHAPSAAVSRGVLYRFEAAEVDGLLDVAGQRTRVTGDLDLHWESAYFAPQRRSKADPIEPRRWSTAGDRTQCFDEVLDVTVQLGP